MKLIILLLCSFGLACASSFTTLATCTSLTTVTDPTSCSVSDSAGGADASASVSGSDAAGYSFDLETDAGPDGFGVTDAQASINGAFPGSYELLIEGNAAGGDGGISGVSVQIGDQTWAITNSEYLYFTVDTTPGETLSAFAYTGGEGGANLEMTYEGPGPSVPEPGAGPLMLIGIFMFCLSRVLHPISTQKAE